MRVWLTASVVGVLFASLVGASGASAAAEFGDNCSADDSTEGAPLILFEGVAPANPLPAAAPSAGVITKWKVNVQPTPGSAPQELRVLRLNAAAKTAQVVGEAKATVTGGQNTFDTRIPVQPGDRLGLYGPAPVGGLFCKDPGGEDVLGITEVGSVGSTVKYAEAPSPVRVPVAALLEPDADNDGFGDETQDKCPQASSLQTECPVVVVDSFALAKKSTIVVLVSTDESAPVTVSGSAKLPKASKASSSAKAKLKKVTRTVPAGKLVRFTLKFPGSLKAALKGLPRGKSITVKLQATATNLAGQVSKDKAKVKLKG